MKDKILMVTTTSSIEGWSIEKYYGIVTYQLVIGTNIFRDNFADFRDIFGGFVKGYQKDLQNLERVALFNLKKKAANLGANIILGLRLDFDELSGWGKSMFMLNAYGTAVSGIPNNDQKIENNAYDRDVISRETLDYEIQREKHYENVSSPNYFLHLANQIEELLKYKTDALEKVVGFIDIYLPENPKKLDEIRDSIADYFRILPVSSINSFLISELFINIKTMSFHYIKEILRAIEWFDYDVIHSLMSKENPKYHSRALYFFTFNKSYFSHDDISQLKKLIESIDKTYSRYPIIGPSGEWKCLNCGKMNNKKTTTCSKSDCQANVFGIPNNKINPSRVINMLENKIKIIEKLLNSGDYSKLIIRED